MKDPERLRDQADAPAVLLEAYVRATAEGPRAEVAAWYRTRARLGQRPGHAWWVGGALAACALLLLVRIVPDSAQPSGGHGGAPGDFGAGGTDGASGARGAGGTARGTS
jgi:hypothetical protein